MKVCDGRILYNQGVWGWCSKYFCVVTVSRFPQPLRERIVSAIVEYCSSTFYWLSSVIYLCITGLLHDLANENALTLYASNRTKNPSGTGRLEDRTERLLALGRMNIILP